MSQQLSLDSRYEELVISLKQIDTLLEIATSTDFSEIKPEVVNNYFWIISDILNKAKITCDGLASIVVLPKSN